MAAALNELPPKILLRIFAFLDLNDLVAAARVNRKFKTAAEHGSLYGQVHIGRRHRLDDVISMLKRQRDAIRVCKMEDVADSNTVLRYVSRCPNLRTLKLVECDGERGIRRDAFEALFAGTEVRELTLKSCELETFPGLRRLRNATSIRVVDNTGYQQPLDYVAELLPALDANVGTLRSLKLRIENVTAADQDRLFDRVEKCAALRALHFQYPHVDPLSERNFRKLFRLRNLSALSAVVADHVDPRCYREFVERPCAANFVKLEFGGQISRSLPALLRRCPHLQVLRLTCLSGPFLRATDQQLLRMLAANRELRDVSLKSVSVNNLRHVVLQLPKYLPQLEHVEIETDGGDGSSADNAAHDSTNGGQKNGGGISETPLKIEFNLLPNFALETQNLESSTIYVLFRSEELLKFITSGQLF